MLIPLKDNLLIEPIEEATAVVVVDEDSVSRHKKGVIKAISDEFTTTLKAGDFVLYEKNACFSIDKYVLVSYVNIICKVEAETDVDDKLASHNNHILNESIRMNKETEKRIANRLNKEQNGQVEKAIEKMYTGNNSDIIKIN